MKGQQKYLVTSFISSVLITIFMRRSLLGTMTQKQEDMWVCQKLHADKMYLWIHKENELIIDYLIMEVKIFL